MNFDKKINHLKSLKQYKDKSDEELLIIAKDQYEKEEILGHLTFCINEEEKAFAKNLLENYLSQRDFEDFSERDTLRQLIDIEILQERCKSFLNNEYNKANPLLPTKMMEELRNNNEQIEELKKKLGLGRKDQDSQTWIEYWERLKQKVLNYHETHKGLSTVKCPYCLKLFHLILRMDGKEEIKSEWFRDTILYNQTLFECYHNKELSKEKVSKILGVSEKYIDFIYNKLYLKDLHDRKNNE